jgi:hypothetical protein
LNRAVATVVCLFVLGSTLSACRRGLFGGPRVERVRLDVARTGDDVVFTADDLFETILCTVYDAGRAPGGAPETIPGNAPAGPRGVRFIWRARCPYRNDCARVVVYGDKRLESELQPVPLRPSEPGECYLCSVSGDRRRGEVLFSIGAGGEIAACPDSTRRRR